MTAPRLVRPNATYSISRRVERRRFLLRPDSKFTELFKWVLAVTAAQFGVEVHVATCMSTHFHLVVTVPNSNVSEFMHRLNLRLSKSLQVLRKYVDGVVWAPGELNIVELRTRDAVIQQPHPGSTRLACLPSNPGRAGIGWV